MYVDNDESGVTTTPEDTCEKNSPAYTTAFIINQPARSSRNIKET